MARNLCPTDAPIGLDFDNLMLKIYRNEQKRENN